MTPRSQVFDVVVSIINYRTAGLTLQCVQSAVLAIDGCHGHVVVVDNASGDGSSEEISRWLQDRPELPVTLVQSESNTGFSGGHNQGTRCYDAEYYLVLNSDALLRPGFFAEILGTARRTGAGLVAPRIEYDDGTPQESCFRFPTPWSEIINSAKTGPITTFLSRHNVSLGVPPDPSQIEWASFACILLNGKMVREIGPMDEGYFLYFEDTEYCWRARQAGWSIVHEPAARAVHFRGGSGPVKAQAAAKKRLPAYYYASRTRFFRQSVGPTGPFLANLGWYAGRMIANLRIFTGKGVPPTVEAEGRDIWVNALSPLGDRRAVED